MRFASLTFVALAVQGAIALADPLPAAVRAHAVRREGSVAIDGKLDEAAWTKAPKQGGFTQRFPKDGAKPAHETTFSVLYDDSALYVGVWAADTEPDQIRRTLTRRDVDMVADAIAVGFDSYHDRRTAYVFQLNAAGVQRDMMLFDDSKQDDTWDAVWTGEASIHDRGWCAEFRIPLNQLRFAAGDSQEWGLQVVRMVARTNEQAAWSPWPRSAPEVVSRFGVVDGIDRLKPSRRLELLPYASGGFDVMPVDSADPLNDSTNLRRGAGLDVRYGLGPAFTLSATLNPDFGQVEADPSQVNLSGNELFFAEKRPFFLEGVDLFKLPIGQSDNSPEGAFYSRRIGAAPPAPDMDYDYIKAPTSTIIYSAAKLTGKTRGGWSLGVFDAVTGEETAAVVDATGGHQSPIVAPLTNYALARIKRDLNEGRTSLGASVSAVNPRSTARASSRCCTIRRTRAGSRSRTGSATRRTSSISTASAATCTAAPRRSPRRSARSATCTSAPTSRRATGSIRRARASPASTSRGRPARSARPSTGAGAPAAICARAASSSTTSGSRTHRITRSRTCSSTTPRTIRATRCSTTSSAATSTWCRRSSRRSGRSGSSGTRTSSSRTTGSSRPAATSTTAAGTGAHCAAVPSMHGDNRLQGWINLNSDTRKRVWVSFNMYGGRTPAAHETDGGLEAGVTIQARSNIDLFLGPSYSDRKDAMQYVDQIDDAAGDTHYIFAHIRQTVAGLTMRLNWTFSPRLSLQAYAQPFVANGSYSNYKDVTNPHAKRFEDRFVPIEMTTFDVGRPDFDFMQLRSTLVLRWEYRPGSSIYAIWSHGRTGTDDNGHFDLGRDLSGLGRADGENVVMVKANYWIGL